MDSAIKQYNDYWGKKSSYSKLDWRHLKAFDFVKPNSKVLEIGCGDGTLGSQLISKKNCDVIGIDFSEIALKKAKKRGIKTLNIDIEKDLPFKEKEFDYVIGLEVLEHLFKPNLLLEKISKICHFAIFSYANTVYLKNRLNILLGRIPVETPFRNGEHIYYWSYNSFIKLLSNYAVIEQVKCLGHLPPFTKFLSFNQREFIGNLWPNLLSNGTVVLCNILK